MNCFLFGLIIAFNAYVGLWTSAPSIKTSDRALITDHIKLKAVAPEEDKPCWFILTGAPNSGKTEILKYLNRQGYAVTEEAAAWWINQQQKCNGVAQPWIEPDFQVKITERFCAVKKEVTTDASPLVFWDRGPIDLVTYSCYFKVPCGLAESVTVAEEAMREAAYQTTVFLVDAYAPFTTTADRGEDQPQAQELERLLEKDYEALGFTVVRVPRNNASDFYENVAQRAKFILDHISFDAKRRCFSPVSPEAASSVTALSPDESED